MTTSVIVAGARTPIGRLMGSLKDFSGSDLGAIAIRGALEKAGIPASLVEYVIMGQVLTAGAGQMPARQSAVGAGIGWDVPALTINKMCLSGIDAIALADQLIRAGEFDVVVAGGQESMTRAPHLLMDSRAGYKYGDVTVKDHMAYDGLHDVFTDQPMGALTEQRNDVDKFTRLEQDEFAATSHQKAAAAWKDGVFADEVVPVSIPQRKGDPIEFAEDEGIRANTTAESLGGLRPAAGGREDGPRSARARGLDRGDANDLAPGAAAEAPEAEAAQSLAWAERLVRAHAGDGAHSMLRTLIADLPASRTPWEQVLRTVLARSLSSRPDLSWSRPSRSYLANQGRSGPNRRLPWEPGRSASKAVPRLAVIVDVSGSIEDGLLARFAQEIEAITRRLGAGLVLVVGDDRVRRVEHFEPGRSALRDIAFAGGGGTDFTPLLEEADCHRPDIGVVLTDLEGLARFRPAWPVIWAVPDATVSPVAPFGRKLALR